MIRMEREKKAMERNEGRSDPPFRKTRTVVYGP
jgi:hypothetical protein